MGGGIRPSEFHGRISCLGNYVIIKVAFPISGERMNYSINHSGTVAIHQKQKHSSHQILKFPINSILNLIRKCIKLENCLKFFIFEQNDSNESYLSFIYTDTTLVYQPFLIFPISFQSLFNAQLIIT